MLDIIVGVLSGLGPLGGSAILAIATYSIFLFFDWFFPPSTKAQLSSRLLQQPTKSWSRLIIDMTDGLFVGANSSSYRRPRFLRVICASLFWAVVLTVSFSMFSATYGKAVRSLTGEVGSVSGTIGVVAMFFLLNPVADYISVVETRAFLVLMDKQQRATRIVGLALLELGVTAIIAFTVLPILPVAISGGISLSEYGDFVAELWAGMRFSGMRTAVLWSPYVYTTFLTSFSIWLYVAAEAAFRISPYFRALFPINQRPFQSLGFVAAIVVFVGSTMVSMLRSLV